jgi:hypothetical protein
MSMRIPLTLAAAILIAAMPHAAAQETAYRGMCDASAAVALGPDQFVVADDEANQLKFYRRGQPDPIADDASGDLRGFLAAGSKESDLEGAAVVGKRIYWIASHGRSSKGKVREDRYRFFATDMSKATPRLKPVGKAYLGLLEDLVNADQLTTYALGNAATRAPEDTNGFNIEGLAAAPEGTLLIGLRNPLPHDKALIVPLLNPGELIEGKHAKFGAAIEVDLDKRGIRSIERVDSSYLIVAGPPGKEGKFALYRWSGKAGDRAVQLTQLDFKTLRPEAMFAVPNSGMVQILSDDGTDECQKLDKAKQSFRSVTIKP